MQNQTPSPAEHANTLWFEEKRPLRRHAIRIIQRDDGMPYFAVPDLCAAMGHPDCSKRTLDLLPDNSKYLGCREETEDGLAPVAMVTPVGAWRLTDVLDRYRAQPLAAWTKRTSRDLCPDAAPNDPAMFLVLEPDGSLPPAPTKYSGRLSEWRDLKDSDAYLEARYGLRPVAKKPVQDHLGANG